MSGDPLQLNGLSPAMVTTLFSRAIEPVALLATIQADGLDGLLRLTDCPDARTSTGSKGLVSRGQDFEYFPFSFAFPGAGQGESARGAKVVIGNRSGEIAEALEGVTGQPTITVELVRVCAPDSVERAMTGATLSDHEESSASITANIASRRFDPEPACRSSYIEAKTPSLF